MLKKIVLAILLTVGVLGVVSLARAASGDVITVVDDSATFWDADMVLNSSGNPVIAYRDATNDALKLAVCGNPTCTSKIIRVLDSTMSDSGQKIVSIALNSSGYPVIAYQDSNNRTNVIVCYDATCAGRIVSPGIVGADDYISLALTTADDPRISYHWCSVSKLVGQKAGVK